MEPTNSTRSMNSMKIAILGAGNWGKNHVRVFCELLGEENVLICDLEEARRTAIRSAHPGATVCEHLEFGHVQAVVIATPAVTHFRLAREALLADVDVLVEKPMALTSGEARELVDLADRQDRILMVDHLLEYHPAVSCLKEFVDSGRFGRLLHLTSERLNFGVIRTEENALWSLAPHDISAILYLLGEEPGTVSAMGAAYLQPGIEDVAQTILRFPSGAMGLVRSSWLDPIRTRRLTVVGDAAMAVFDDVADERLVLWESRAVSVGGCYIPQNGEREVIRLPEEEPLTLMARAFLESIGRRTPPRSDGRDGLRVVRVLESAQRSLDHGGTPVILKEGR